MELKKRVLELSEAEWLLMSEMLTGYIENTRDVVLDDENGEPMSAVADSRACRPKLEAAERLLERVDVVIAGVAG